MRVKIIGLGDGGINALKLIAREGLSGVECIAINTFEQSLHDSEIEHRILIGAGVTRGLGAGGIPLMGKQAAETSIDVLQRAFFGANRLFIIGGMGGGTLTGAAPVLARIADEVGAVVYGIVSRPFTFEGENRAQIAMSGIPILEKAVEDLIVIANDNLTQFARSPKLLSIRDAFALTDRALTWNVLARLTL